MYYMQLHVLTSLVQDKDSIPKKSTLVCTQYTFLQRCNFQSMTPTEIKNDDFQSCFPCSKFTFFVYFSFRLKFWPLLKKTWHLIEFLVGQKVVADKYQENAEERLLFLVGKGAEKLFVLWLFNCKELDPFCDLTSFHFIPSSFFHFSTLSKRKTTYNYG